MQSKLQVLTIIIFIRTTDTDGFCLNGLFIINTTNQAAFKKSLTMSDIPQF